MTLPADDPVITGLLQRPNLARLAYIGLDARPKVVPIWFAYDDATFTMVTGPRADKVRAIERNPAVALTIDSHTPPYHVLLIDGDATIEPIDGMAPEYPAIVARYLGAGADAYLANMRVKTQRRIRVSIRNFRVLDFQRRFPKSLR